jgi:hypothetical protein
MVPGRRPSLEAEIIPASSGVIAPCPLASSKDLTLPKYFMESILLAEIFSIENLAARRR